MNKNPKSRAASAALFFGFFYFRFYQLRCAHRSNACTVLSGFFSVFLPTLLSARIFRIIYIRNEKHIIAVQIIISVSDSAGAIL